jgi:hypothetical protein
LSYFYGYPFTLLPTDLVLLGLQVVPEGASTTVLQYDAVIFGLSDCTKEHHNTGMSYCFHRVAFAQEISETDIPIFDFEFLDYNKYFPPFSLVNDTVTALINAVQQLQLTPLNLDVGAELTALCYPVDLEF